MKKLISLILALVLILTSIPIGGVPAYASGYVGSTSPLAPIGGSTSNRGGMDPYPDPVGLSVGLTRFTEYNLGTFMDSLDSDTWKSSSSTEMLNKTKEAVIKGANFRVPYQYANFFLVKAHKYNQANFNSIDAMEWVPGQILQKYPGFDGMNRQKFVFGVTRNSGLITAPVEAVSNKIRDRLKEGTPITRSEASDIWKMLSNQDAVNCFSQLFDRTTGLELELDKFIRPAGVPEEERVLTSIARYATLMMVVAKAQSGIPRITEWVNAYFSVLENASSDDKSQGYPLLTIEPAPIFATNNHYTIMTQSSAVNAYLGATQRNNLGVGYPGNDYTADTRGVRSLYEKLANEADAETPGQVKMWNTNHTTNAISFSGPALVNSKATAKYPQGSRFNIDGGTGQLFEGTFNSVLFSGNMKGHLVFIPYAIKSNKTSPADGDHVLKISKTGTNKIPVTQDKLKEDLIVTIKRENVKKDKVEEFKKWLEDGLDTAGGYPKITLELSKEVKSSKVNVDPKYVVAPNQVSTGFTQLIEKGGTGLTPKVTTLTAGTRIRITKEELLKWYAGELEINFDDKVKDVKIDKDETIEYIYSSRVTVFKNDDFNGGRIFMPEEINKRAGGAKGPKTLTAKVAFVRGNGPTPGDPTPPPNQPREITWFSDLPVNFAEIKHNAPLQEGFEAMAGVPTGEPMYVSIGGTPYVVELKLKYHQDIPIRRKYRAYFTAVDDQYRKGDQGPTWNIPGGVTPSMINMHQGGSFSRTWTGSVPNKATAVTGNPTATCTAIPDRTAYNAALAEANAAVAAINATIARHTNASEGTTRTYTFQASITANTVTDPKTTTAGPTYDNSKPPKTINVTANPGAAGSFTITVSGTVPPGMIDGFTSTRVLPQVEDTWVQEYKVDYMEIVDAHVWKLEQGKLEGGDLPQLFNTNEVKLSITKGDPTLFVNIAAENNSKNGRVRYSYEPGQHDEVVWNLGPRSNTSNGVASNPQNYAGPGQTSKYRGISKSHTAYSNTKDAHKTFFTAIDQGTPEFRKFDELRRTMTEVTTISDFLVLQVDGKDIPIMYFEKKAPKAVQLQEHPGNIKASSQDMWENNKNSAGSWATTQLPSIISYNGLFASPRAKFSTVGTDRMKSVLDTLPAGFTRPTRPNTGTILVNTNTLTLNNVSNGAYDTGHAQAFYRKLPITDSKGNNKSTGTYNVAMDNTAQATYGAQGHVIDNVPYSQQHFEINDIVVHSPVSSEKAVVISLPAELDQRTNETRLRGGNLQPPREETFIKLKDTHPHQNFFYNGDFKEVEQGVPVNFNLYGDAVLNGKTLTIQGDKDENYADVFVNVLPDTQFTFNATNSTGKVLITEYNTDGEVKSEVEVGIPMPRAWRTNAETTKVRFRFYESVLKPNLVLVANSNPDFVPQTITTSKEIPAVAGQEINLPLNPNYSDTPILRTMFTKPNVVDNGYLSRNGDINNGSLYVFKGRKFTLTEVPKNVVINNDGSLKEGNIVVELVDNVPFEKYDGTVSRYNGVKVYLSHPQSNLTSSNSYRDFVDRYDLNMLDTNNVTVGTHLVKKAYRVNSTEDYPALIYGKSRSGIEANYEVFRINGFIPDDVAIIEGTDAFVDGDLIVAVGPMKLGNPLTSAEIDQYGRILKDGYYYFSSVRVDDPDEYGYLTWTNRWISLSNSSRPYRPSGWNDRRKFDGTPSLFAAYTNSDRTSDLVVSNEIKQVYKTPNGNLTANKYYTIKRRDNQVKITNNKSWNFDPLTQWVGKYLDPNRSTEWNLESSYYHDIKNPNHREEITYTQNTDITVYERIAKPTWYDGDIQSIKLPTNKTYTFVLEGGSGGVGRIPAGTPVPLKYRFNGKRLTSVIEILSDYNNTVDISMELGGAGGSSSPGAYGSSGGPSGGRGAYDGGNGSYSSAAGGGAASSLTINNHITLIAGGGGGRSWDRVLSIIDHDNSYNYYYDDSTYSYYVSSSGAMGASEHTPEWVNNDSIFGGGGGDKGGAGGYSGTSTTDRYTIGQEYTTGNNRVFIRNLTETKANFYDKKQANGRLEIRTRYTGPTVTSNNKLYNPITAPDQPKMIDEYKPGIIKEMISKNYISNKQVTIDGSSVLTNNKNYNQATKDTELRIIPLYSTLTLNTKYINPRIVNGVLSTNKDYPNAGEPAHVAKFVDTTQLLQDGGTPATRITLTNKSVTTPPDDWYETVTKTIAPDAPVDTPEGTTFTPGNFILLDRPFQIYYPNRGDFYGHGLLGLADLDMNRGLGYIDGMDTTKYTKAKYVKFDFPVIHKGVMYGTREPISLTVEEETFDFYVPLVANEAMSALVEFYSIATNNEHDIRDGSERTNKNRTGRYQAAHSSEKRFNIDVVGRIGNQTILDTTDLRFSNMFKNPAAGTEWIVPGVLRKVNLSSQNRYVGDTRYDIRGMLLRNGYNLNTYGTLPHLSSTPLPFPFDPTQNTVAALRKDPMRIGYKQFNDIQTIGNYQNGTVQIRPYYYAVDARTGISKELDVYMKNEQGNYVIINKHGAAVPGWDPNSITNYSIPLNWREEYYRRMFTDKEKQITERVCNSYLVADANGNNIPMQAPAGTYYDYGNAQLMLLTPRNRTFIGAPMTHEYNTNPGSKYNKVEYEVKAQRWHFSLGLPSSAVFVEKGAQPTQANIDKVKRINNGVVVIAADIISTGQVYNLRYKHGNNASVSLLGNPPVDLTEIPYEIITTISIDRNSSDDITTGGTH